jgi:hypothetical protein
VNLVTLSFGLLMLACALTLLANGPRTWILAFAQGIGIQAIIAFVMGAVQVGWILENTDGMSWVDKGTTALEGIPFNAGGWSSRMIFERATADMHPGAMGDLDSYLPIAAAQIAVVAAIMAWRKMQDEHVCDLILLFTIGLLITNTVCNMYWPWWGQ